MKNKKIIFFFCRVVSIIVVLSLMILPLKAYATSVSQLEYEQFLPYVYEAAMLDSEIESSPFYELDMDQVGVGVPIISYTYDGGHVSKSKALNFPLFYGEKLIAFSYVTLTEENQLVGVELSSELVEEFSNYVGQEICIVYTATDTYVYAHDEFSFVKSYASMITLNQSNDDALAYNAAEIQDMKSVVASAQIETEKLTNMYSFSALQKNHSIPFQHSISTLGAERKSSTYPSSHYLYATIVQQHGLPICWAGAVASIGLEITGISYTAEYVSQYMLGDYEGGNTYLALLALQLLYGLDGVDLYRAPSLGEIRSAIYDKGYPIYVRVYGASSAGILRHALFIDGYSDYGSGYYAGSLRVGDSNFTTFRTIYYAADKYYPYTLNGITGYINEHINLY